MNNSERWHHQPALYMGAFSAMAERGEHIVVPAVPAARDPESEALATAVRSHADEETRELAGASRAASSILHEELARMASVWAAQGEQQHAIDELKRQWQSLATTTPIGSPTPIDPPGGG